MIDVISIIIGGIGTITSLMGFSYQLKKENYYSFLRDQVLTRKDLIKRDITTEDEELVSLIDYGILLLPSLKKGVYIRLGMSITAIISATTYLYTEGSFQTTAETVLAVFLYLFQGFIALLNFKQIFIKEDEKIFLKVMAALDRWFHDEYIQEAMVNFSIKALDNKKVRYQLAKMDNDQSKIESYLMKKLANKKELPKKPIQPTPKGGAADG